ncbi:MAG: substrate-binding domain-containing protein [Actinomycetota bacterium]|nr:substrate-binding domain-containing protein [Actinomycetota bacterium]MDA8269508.1 substrate-binding domain-containing protein [Actinomycetota bacterium]
MRVRSLTSRVKVAAVAGVALSALVLAACGSSTPSASSGKSSSSGAQSQAADVTSLLTRPTTFTVPSLPSKPPTGKTVDFMACGVPVCQNMGQFVKQAAQALGWNFQEIQEGETPQTVSSAYDQAVRNDPAGVVGSGGFSASLMSHQLQQLKAEGSTAVLVDVPSAGNATAVVLSSSTQATYGKEMGEWIVNNAHGKDAHVGIMTSPATPIYAAAHQALANVLSSSCKGCTTTTYTFPYTDVGTTLPTKVVTFLTSHPSINYLFFDFSNEVDGVPAALQAAGLSHRVKIVTTDDTATETPYLTQGQESASAGIAWPEMLWGAVNIIVRNTMHLPLAPALDIQYPNMILTGSNLPAAASTGMFPLVASYQSIYKTAWHLQ